MSDDTRERIVALEVKVEHLSETLAETNTVVRELRDLLLQAKGARWMIGILIAIGGFMAGIAAKYLPFLPR
ncbi:hypothetical protein [Microvirga alba]|uniref:Uncharacterized protein n=1 Tax=Microvirga alba TaxID=2791025 RepID=A0A931BT11_9HYPH|nr:hypothetical protein [Microvirga alba]MBF9234675.1 hypothetical protein [Microvirga alba]